MNNVVVNNGFGRFHLVAAAQHAFSSGQLAHFITGAYPPAWMLRCKANYLPSPLRRLAERNVGVPRSIVTGFRFAEAVHQLSGIPLRTPALRSAYRPAAAVGMRVYQQELAHLLREASFDARIFHCRSGFGGRSAICTAQNKGMYHLSDHSIAHPLVLPALVRTDGKLEVDSPSKLDGVERLILRDLQRADSFVVNSNFVKQTFVAAGVDERSIRVVYTLPDKKFLTDLNDLNLRSDDGRFLRVIFAGTVCWRKGAKALFNAIHALHDCIEFTVAGMWDAECLHMRSSIAALTNVRVLGILSREELARSMSQHDVLFFPTLAEGSARVVVEAMAAGCAVLTTPNAGSLVPHEDVSQIVDPWEFDEMIDRLLEMYSSKSATRQLGSTNRAIVNSQLVRGYGEQMISLYKELF